MNIFCVDRDPIKAARMLPDRHVTKMILESAQMLSIVYSPHYWDIGEVAKVNGDPFKTAKGAFKNHPCTQWAAASEYNCAWLIQHAMGLLEVAICMGGSGTGYGGATELLGLKFGDPVRIEFESSPAPATLDL